jgi:predicted small lipoprotein YifL
MRRFIKYLLPALLLALCLSLAACGSGGDTDTDTDAAPDSFEGMVKDSDRMVSLSDYGGTWAGDDGSTMLIEAGGDGDEVRFALYDTGDEVTASGFIQSVPDYGCDYFYNEHDGVAYQFSADGSSVNIYSLGSFTYEMSLDEFDAQAEDYNSSDSSVDLSYLAGIWYLDGDLDADSYIYIDSSGGLWGLYERAPGAETTEVDGGFISAPTDVDDVYYAVSTTYQDVTYEFTLFDTDSIVWGGENDYYERLE